MHLLEPIWKEDPENINWWFLSANPAAVKWFQDLDPDDMWRLIKPSINTNTNPAAIHLLEQHPDKIDWVLLSANPAAIHLLEQHPDKIEWCFLSMNSAAIHLLETHPDKIRINVCLSANPSIFEPDFQKMKRKQCAVYKEELMQRVFHPSRIAKLLAMTGINIEMLDDYL